RAWEMVRTTARSAGSFTRRSTEPPLLSGVNLVALERAFDMLAVAQLGVHAPGRAALVDRERARARGGRGHEVADLQSQLACAVEQAADLVSAGAPAVGVD